MSAIDDLLALRDDDGDRTWMEALAEAPPIPTHSLDTTAIFLAKPLRAAGGPGSGNFGHAGRPGEVGGSAPNDGGLVPSLAHVGIMMPDGHDYIGEREDHTDIARRIIGDDSTNAFRDVMNRGGLRYRVFREGHVDLHFQAGHMSAANNAIQLLHDFYQEGANIYLDVEPIPTKQFGVLSLEDFPRFFNSLREASVVIRRAGSLTPDIQHLVAAMRLGHDAALIGKLSEHAQVRTLGGPGSGNFGHAGRPGEVGGSAPSGGSDPRGRQMPLPWSSSGSAGTREILHVPADKPFSNPPRVIGEVVPPAGDARSPDDTPDGKRDSLETPVSVSGDSEHLGGGINESLVVESDDGSKYVFKPVDGEEFGARSGRIDNEDAPLAEREVLASRVDRELGLNLVPNTMFGEFEGRSGSLQEFISGSDYNDDAAPAELARMGILDAVIGNLDRHGGNLMTADDGSLIAIDHGYSFGKTTPGEGLRSFPLARIEDGDLPLSEQTRLAAMLDRFNYSRVLHGSHLDSDEQEALRQRIQVVASRLAKGEAHLIKDDFEVDRW